MRRRLLWCYPVLTLLALSALLTGVPAASSARPSVTGERLNQAAEDTLYVAIIWHQHQPVYFKDPETGLYVRPWVRVHAAKDYLDMVAILEDYPAIHATFNLTPSLIRQLDDIAAGAKDLYWAMAEIPADELAADEKRFILERFFDINPRIIARFPRYQALADSRTALGINGALESWSAGDFRDLQVLFNLGWTDPDWLAEEPLAGLVAKGEGFDEADKDVLFAEHLRLVQEVIPFHARMQEAGQIEVTMTPFAHPILPLLVDSSVAAVAMPEAELPSRFTFGQDAVAQVQLGVALYEEHFGLPPRGMWPAEGSVSPQIIQMVANAGIQWIATDEGVLAHSLPDVQSFTRDSDDVVQQADALYRPYTVTGGRGGQVAVLFRDRLISDMVGFQYSGLDGDAAAEDFVRRLDAIQARLAEESAAGPHLVTVLLDGENAWEYYPNDGKAFLHGIYRRLSEAENLRTVTPSEFLAMTGEPRPLENLWPGSWISADFSTWIGEDEENQAWEYLLQTRQALQEASRQLDETALQQALDLMYIAEGSDWFWWYGADQNSGSDESFDQQFRGYLRQIYTAIGQEAPGFVDVPVIPQLAQQPDQPFAGPFTPVIDGVVGTDEWASAARYDLDAGPLTALYAGMDDAALYLRLDAAGDFADLAGAKFSFYFTVPDRDWRPAAFVRGMETRLGFGAKRAVEVTLGEGEALSSTIYTSTPQGSWGVDGSAGPVSLPAGAMAAGDRALEVAVPLDHLSGQFQPGARFNVRLAVIQGDGVTLYPPHGPALLALPDEAVPNVVVEVEDPTGDDHGPGTYVYPRDPVFRGGAYDATRLVVGYDEEDVIFRLSFRGAVENDWGAPNGMGIHTVDIYLDVDGPGNGARLLLPGRNAALPEAYAWDYAIWAEGWTPGIYQPGDEGPVQMDGRLEISTNPAQRRITVRVSRRAIPGDPATWSYAVVVASQEGYPAAGVWRIRDVLPVAEQWRVGGGPEDTNHTRILDVIYPEAGVQEAMLADYLPSQASVGTLGPDDFGQVPVITPE